MKEETQEKILQPKKFKDKDLLSYSVDTPVQTQKKCISILGNSVIQFLVFGIALTGIGLLSYYLATKGLFIFLNIRCLINFKNQY